MRKRSPSSFLPSPLLFVYNIAMNQIICLFLPAMLSFSKKDYKAPVLYILKKYSLFCILSNFISMAAVSLLHAKTGQTEELFTFSFSLKYLTISCLFVIFVSLTSKAVTFNISAKRSNENHKKTA